MIAIVKYNAGNIFSVQCAMKRINAEAILTDDPSVLNNADKVIFPGVGEASSAMRYLRETNLDAVIKNLTNPVLGICVGQQLMCRHSQEGEVDCLNIFDVDVKRFVSTNDDKALKIPHMGWNTLDIIEENALITKEMIEKYVYYVHSYYAELSPYTIATTNYIVPFSAAMKKDNFYSTQFHPEKSGETGETILKNFLEI